ncbi:alpha/beta hydrolase [Caldovatus sediminis]|uniref:Alpha/beta hydrolase n=2 Tax=Caldovatus sediminis TaxID=2041189 RepID=A0A8J2Z9X6_9PROT|nr:alpha/beta hydrolase [Caldovatus sediminis]
MRSEAPATSGTMPAPAPAAEAPEAALARLDAAARRSETPCGEGHMVWRAWGDGPPLVLLHGGSGSWRHWARNIAHFARRRLVLAPDLPGLGESAMPPPPIEPGATAGIVAAGLRALLGGEARYDLVGFSYGANIAGHVAAAEGERVRSLTIVGAGALGLARGHTPLQKVRDKQGAARLAAHRFNLASLMFADPARIDGLALAIQEWNTVHARLRSRPLAHTPSLREAIERATAPLAAIYGERDAIAWPNLHLRLALLRELRPEAAIHVIPGAGHWVAYEAAEAFNAALDAVLPRVSGAT